jgi:uncharacterized SAM-binding protein YcdF (DUF218 family)
MDAPSLARPDAIVVLGCRTSPGGAPSAAALRRAERAATAWLTLGPVPVIASGGRRWGDTAEADVLLETMAGLGVPRQVIGRELYSLSTTENAWYTAELLRGARLTRPALVTCDWHMRRALACFERVGVLARPFPAATPPQSLASRWARGALERARRWVDTQGAVESPCPLEAPWTGS